MLSFTVMYYLYLAQNFGQTVITIHCNDLESLFHNSRVLPFCFIDILSIYMGCCIFSTWLFGYVLTEVENDC